MKRLRKAMLAAIPTCWLWLYEPETYAYRFWRTNYRVPLYEIVEAAR